MGKKGKALRKQIKAQAKRSQKAANRAKYAAMRDSGMNQKSKHARKTSKKNKKASPVLHPSHDCGNIGCNKCNPDERNSNKVLSINDTIKFLRDKYPGPVVPMTKRQKKLTARRAT
jgi:hypothetical protein